MTVPTPSPEVKAIISEFVKKQRERFGDDWKAKLAAEMTAKTMPGVKALLDLMKVPK